METKDSPPPPAITRPRRDTLRFLIGLALLILAVILLSRFAPAALSSRFQTLVTIFLGILIEALPFLLAGSIVSGFIEIFIDRDTLARFVPRRALPAAFAGALLGFAFPVCECGVVPVTRRLYSKGLPVSVGIAFLLAAPVINPIVLLSTYAAFGFGPVLIGRFLFSFLIAFVTGLIFSTARPEEVLLPATIQTIHAPPPGHRSAHACGKYWSSAATISWTWGVTWSSAPSWPPPCRPWCPNPPSSPWAAAPSSPSW